MQASEGLFGRVPDCLALEVLGGLFGLIEVLEKVYKAVELSS